MTDRIGAPTSLDSISMFRISSKNSVSLENLQPETLYLCNFGLRKVLEEISPQSLVSGVILSRFKLPVFICLFVFFCF